MDIITNAQHPNCCSLFIKVRDLRLAQGRKSKSFWRNWTYTTCHQSLNDETATVGTPYHNGSCEINLTVWISVNHIRIIFLELSISPYCLLLFCFSFLEVHGRLYPLMGSMSPKAVDTIGNYSKILLP